MKYAALLSLLSFSGLALAEAVTTVAGSTAATATPGLPSPGLTFAKVLVVLGFIVGLILASAWFARRSGLAGFVSHTNFKVLASLPLGHKEKAVLIKVGKQYMLLGVTSSSVNYLQSYNESENPLAHHNQDIENSRAKINNDKTGIDFAAQIKKLLGQGLPR